VIGADVVRSLFALRGVDPFSRLDDTELLLIAQHAHWRSFAAGRVVLPAGITPEALFMPVEGQALAGEAPAPPVFDAPALLFGFATSCEYAAGPGGLTALVIAKPHMFTIARECPEFVVGLRDLAEGARR